MNLTAVSKRVACNVLRVAAVGDFGALHCQPAQKFDRSTQLQFCTSPPIEATRCYQLAFLTTVSVNHCQYCVSVSLSVSCWSVRLRIFYFLKGRRFFLIQFCLRWNGGSFFASFGLCLGLCGLQMCLHLCVGLFS